MGAVPNEDGDRIIEVIGKFCTNVEHISIQLTELKYSILIKLFENLQNCTVLELPDCSLDDSSILALEKLPKLKFFSVAKNSSLTDQHISRLTTVKDLLLQCCSVIKPSYFTEIIKSLKNLQSLDIQYCNYLK